MNTKNRPTQTQSKQDKGSAQKKHEAYVELGKKGGEARAQELGHEGYVEMGKKGGQARAEELGCRKPGTVKHRRLRERDSSDRSSHNPVANPGET